MREKINFHAHYDEEETKIKTLLRASGTTATRRARGCCLESSEQPEQLAQTAANEERAWAAAAEQGRAPGGMGDLDFLRFCWDW